MQVILKFIRSGQLRTLHCSSIEDAFFVYDDLGAAQTLVDAELLCPQKGTRARITPGACRQAIAQELAIGLEWG
ncbi:hypothetical protein [Pseudomonas sp. R5(2019)]|uniref:hypothetical protein n=1 Tax=Pseudomonas sp. R5(2019) TaxID=2697566 RepID=UPI0014136614|nr:hypothetical protein [Pseudomonas sp. R5(2019)]NBA96595.1 hypothetical protein [Pseudomonas sp. R5(2019)]